MHTSTQQNYLCISSVLILNKTISCMEKKYVRWALIRATRTCAQPCNTIEHSHILRPVQRRKQICRKRDTWDFVTNTRQKLIMGTYQSSHHNASFCHTCRKCLLSHDSYILEEVDRQTTARDRETCPLFARKRTRYTVHNKEADA